MNYCAKIVILTALFWMPSAGNADEKGAPSVAWLGDNRLKVTFQVPLPNSCYSLGEKTSGAPVGTTPIANVVALTQVTKFKAGVACLQIYKVVEVTHEVVLEEGKVPAAVLIYSISEQAQSTSAYAAAIPPRS